MSIPYTDIDKLYINGEWVPPSTSLTDPVFNPATEEVIGNAPVGVEADVEAAVSAARDAFDKGPWPRMTFAERVVVLRKFFAALEARKDKIFLLLRAEVGSTDILTSAIQWAGIPISVNHALDLGTKVHDEALPLEMTPSPMDPSSRTASSGISLREPYGVVACITPYNFPLLMNVSKIAPALVTGNTVVLKPSPFTPYSALMLGQIADEVGLPKGVLNIITGGAEAGALLTTSRGVDMITFTGSDVVGSSIMAQAAPTLKRVHFELGGKSALIVRADANLQFAAQTAVTQISIHAGQGCALNTRWIVHNSVRAEFAEMCKQIAGFMKIGDPSDPTSIVGPLIREQARARTERFVEEALDAGSRLVFGGSRPVGLTKGYFYTPTLFDDVDNMSTLAQKEVFGPIGAMMGFDTDDEAIRLSNQSDFGLQGGIISADVATAIDMARQIRTGQVWINGGAGGFAVGSPMGGYKRSGIGREYGPDWLNDFMEQKGIIYPVGR